MFVGSECPPIAMKSNSLYGAVRWSDVLRFSTDSVTDSVTDSIDSVPTRSRTGVAMSRSGRTEPFWSVGTSQRGRHAPAAPCIVVVTAWRSGVWPAMRHCHTRAAAGGDTVDTVGDTVGEGKANFKPA